MYNEFIIPAPVKELVERYKTTTHKSERFQLESRLKHILTYIESNLEKK